MSNNITKIDTTKDNKIQVVKEIEAIKIDDSLSITINTKTNEIDGTAFLKNYNKLTKNFLRMKSSKKIIASLENLKGRISPFKKERGRYGRTWISQELFPSLLQWADPVKANMITYRLFQFAERMKEEISKPVQLPTPPPLPLPSPVKQVAYSSFAVRMQDRADKYSWDWNKFSTLKVSIEMIYKPLERNGFIIPPKNKPEISVYSLFRKRMIALDIDIIPYLEPDKVYPGNLKDYLQPQLLPRIFENLFRHTCGYWLFEKAEEYLESIDITALPALQVVKKELRDSPYTNQNAERYQDDIDNAKKWVENVKEVNEA